MLKEEKMGYTPQLIGNLFCRAGIYYHEVRDNMVEFRVSQTEFFNILFSPDYTRMELNYSCLRSADDNDTTDYSVEKSKAEKLVFKEDDYKTKMTNRMEHDLKVLKSAYFDACFSRTFRNAIILQGDQTDNILYLFYDSEDGFIRDIKLIPIVQLFEDMSMFSGISVVGGEDYIVYDYYDADNDDDFVKGFDL